MGRNNFPEDKSIDGILEKLFDRLERLERSEGSTIVEGGSIDYTGTELVIKNTAGTVIFKVGLQNNGDFGIAGYRDNGTLAFSVRKQISSGDTSQLLRLHDKLGNVIGGDSLAATTGFDAPYIPNMWRPADRSDAKTTTSATFVTLFKCATYHQNPAIPFVFHTLASDGTTTGQIQVLGNGSPLGPNFGAPWLGSVSGTAETLVTSSALMLPGAMGDAIDLEVQVKRTAGTGTVSVGIARSLGREA